MKIPFDFSIDDWIERFRFFFSIIANFLKEAFDIDLFNDIDQEGLYPLDT